MRRALTGAVLWMLLAVMGWWAPSTLAYQHSKTTRSHQAVAGPVYLVLIVLDGAKPAYLDTPNTPNLQALLARGTRYPDAWTGILESETPSGHAAIATGSEPWRNGISSFGWVTAANRNVNLFDPAKIRAGALERVMLQAGVPTIAGLVHTAIPGSRVVALSGYKYYAADALGGPRADVIMYYTPRAGGVLSPTFIPGHVPPQSVLTAPNLTGRTVQSLGMGNREAMNLAAATFTVMHQQVTLINLPEFDWPLGHLWGASRARASVANLMQSFDQDLGMLEAAYRRAGVLRRTIFVLTADHGFATIYRSVPAQEIRDAVAAAGTSVVRDTYHTGAYLWLRDRNKSIAAAQTIQKLHVPYIQSVYYKRFLGGAYRYAAVGDHFLAAGMERANQYLLHSFVGPNAPDLVVLFTEGAVGTTVAQSSWKGDHGGADWQSQHIPLVIAGPGFRRDLVSRFPARLMDIAPTALTAMGVPHTRMEGLDLADAMQAPPATATTAQQIAGAQLEPVVSALQREAQLETIARRRGR